MQTPVNLVLDTDTDTLSIQVPAAGGESDVTLLTLDLRRLSVDDRRRLRHIRDESREQRAPGPDVPTR